MFRKDTPWGRQAILPAGNAGSSGLKFLLRKLAHVESEDDRVRAELLRLLYAALPVVLTANLANGALVVFVFWKVMPPGLLIGWYALLCATVGIRTWLWNRHRREQPLPEQADRWGQLAAIGSGASGTLWGVAGTMFLVPGSPIHEIVLAFVLGGM